MTPKQKTNILILDPHITGCSKCLNKPGLFTNADSVYTTAWLSGWVVSVTSSNLSHNLIFSSPFGGEGFRVGWGGDNHKNLLLPLEFHLIVTWCVAVWPFATSMTKQTTGLEWPCLFLCVNGDRRLAHEPCTRYRRYTCIYILSHLFQWW